MWDKCGMSRNAEGLETAIEEISALEKRFLAERKGSGNSNRI